MQEGETLLDNEVPIWPGFGENREGIHLQGLSQNGREMHLCGLHKRLPFTIRKPLRQANVEMEFIQHIGITPFHQVLFLARGQICSAAAYKFSSFVPA